MGLQDETLRAILLSRGASPTERASRLDSLDDGRGRLKSWLEDAAAHKDWLQFNGALPVAFHRPPGEAWNVLCSVLAAEIPEVNNEDVASVLGEIAESASLECLYEAARREVEWDEFHAVSVKCVWAIGAIGTARAIRMLEALSEDAPDQVRHAARQELARIRSQGT